jgi:acyl-CoA synthetase (AMP-forming)/AMP-acid ligase II
MCTSSNRLKDMIVTGGENAYSGEVEAVLYEHPQFVKRLSSEYQIHSGATS